MIKWLLIFSLVLPVHVFAQDEFDVEIENDLSGPESMDEAPDIIESQDPVQNEQPTVKQTPLENRLATPQYSQKQNPVPKSGGVRMEPHPQAGKGLIRINKDGSYQYRVKLKKKSASGSFRFATMTPPAISSSDGSITYESMYGKKNLNGLLFDYEWQPFRGFGSLGLKFETGFSMASAKGYLGAPPSSTRSEEEYTLFMVPLSAMVVYRFEYARRQWFVPYVFGGASYFGLIEIRDDNDPAKFGGAPAALAGGGIMISLTAWNTQSAFALSEEYGIADMWFSIEGRAIQGLNETVDVTSQALLAGITVDF